MTESDETRHHVTDRQSSVIDTLLSGKTITETAEEFGLSRQTVSNWINNNHVFKEEKERRQRNIRQESSELLHSALGKSIKVIINQLDKGDVVTARWLLSQVGIIQLLTDTKATEPNSGIGEVLKARLTRMESYHAANVSNTEN